ncbi:hypothetical protein ACQRIT_006462 [Beauveria bassiana]
MGGQARSDNELQRAEVEEVRSQPSATDDEKVPIQRTNSRAPYSVHSKSVKRLLVIAASATAIFSPISAQIYLPALIPIAKSLHVSATKVNLTITAYMVFQGITPMFVGSLADAGGRRPAYIVCFVIYLAANIGLALAPNYSAVLVLRCLQSAGSSSTVALCTAVVADVVTSAERGQKNRKGDMTADLEEAPETVPGASEKKFKFEPPNLLEAVMMLFRRGSGLLLWSSSIIFAGFYCITAAMPAIFHKRYHMNETQVGLMYLPIAGGSIIAAFAVGRGMTWNYKRHCAMTGIQFDRSRQMDMSNFPIERARLEIGIPLMVLAGACLIGWGWAVHFRAHIAVLCVIMVFLGIGLIGMTNATNVLLVDMHPGKAGTATAANNLGRVGPKEVWFNTKEAYDHIYSTGIRGYEKSDFYLATALTRPRIDWRLHASFDDNLDLLSETDMNRYRLQRRLIGRVYRTANAVRHEQAVDKVMDEVIRKFDSIDGAEIDLKEWMHIISVESLGAMVLSWSPGMIKAGTDRATSYQSYLGWRRKSVFGLFPLIVKLEVNYKWVGRLFGIVWGVTYQTPRGFKPFFPEVARKVARRIKNKSNPTSSQREDLLTDLINLHKDKPEFTESYLRKMAITNFGAGHETLASTLIAIMAMLGTHPEVQATATNEIRCQNAAKSRKPGSNISYADALELVYTRAVIREAMRLYPVISMSLPRVVPLHGSGLQLYGLRIPPGATVGCNPVSLHRNEDICGPDPDKFDPRRWLAGSGTPDNIRALERYSLSWGGGSRTCPGRHVAEMIVLKCVVRLLDRFEVRAAVPPPEDQGPTYFLAMLTGVRASFVPLEECGMKQR